MSEKIGNILKKGNIAYGDMQFLNLPSRDSDAAIKILIKQGAIFGEPDEGGLYCQIWDCSNSVAYTDNLGYEPLMQLNNIIVALGDALAFINHHESLPLPVPVRRTAPLPVRTAATTSKRQPKHKNAAYEVRIPVYSPFKPGRANMLIRIYKDSIMNSNSRKMRVVFTDCDDNTVELHNSVSSDCIANAKRKLNTLKTAFENAVHFIETYKNEA